MEVESPEKEAKEMHEKAWEGKQTKLMFVAHSVESVALTPL